jgi:hypothetical protein
MGLSLFLSKPSAASESDSAEQRGVTTLVVQKHVGDVVPPIT